MNLQQQKEKALEEIEGEVERAQQMKHAREAYKRGKITLSFLLWYAIHTAKYLLKK